MAFSTREIESPDPVTRVAAALEPETQSSYAANRVLMLPKVETMQPSFLPLYRLPNALALPAVVYETD